VSLEEILAQIDREIAQLKQARALLSGERPSVRKSGSTPKTTRKKHRLSPEGRKRIAEAVRRRWAEQRKASGGK